MVRVSRGAQGTGLDLDHGPAMCESVTKTC
jgi:hypothetical protein